jgi:lipoprotein-anchoring transpeptidase ErfK/SrfK
MNWKLIVLLLTAALLLSPARAAAQAGTGADEPGGGAVVCAPDAYLIAPDDCLPLGPSVYLTDLARLGLTLPIRPLPAYKPSPDLRLIPYRYFHMSDDVTPKFYPSLADAKAPSDNAQVYAPGFVYISYTSMDETGHFFMSKSGFWIRGDGSRISEIPSFQGLLFRATPRKPFGWSSSYEQIPVKNGPGYNAADTGRLLQPYTVVQVFYTYMADGAAWDMIGPDQWVEGRKISMVTPNPTPPAGVSGDRWIEVNLEEQSLSVYENQRMVFATTIASGLEPFWTRPGLFQIYQKKETETMRNNDPSDFYYLEDVPYTMYFDGVRALHGAYWRTGFGFPQSHGCVNLSVGDAHWLFDWAREGDWVYVHDPSGLTPTDPALYTGGAY